jgi:PAS domain S-box-containing protein
MNSKMKTVLPAKKNNNLNKQNHKKTINGEVKSNEISATLLAEQAALQLSTEKLRDYFETATIGLHWVGPDGTILWANKAEMEMLGYTADEYIGADIRRFHADQNTIQDILTRLTNNEKLYNYEAKMVCKDGSIRYVLINSSVLWQDGKFIHTRCFTRDITEMKELEQRKDDFISMASHELKTPVTSMKVYIQLLQEMLAEQEKPSKYLGKVDEQIDKLTKLITSMLDLGRMQAGKLDYQQTLFDYDDLVSQVAENLQVTTKKHTISIEGIAKDKIFGDRDRLGQVLTNLIDNAIKYSPEANKIIVKIKANKNTFTTEIKDFGMGIDEKHLKHIFSRFYRVYDENEKTFPGLGIGLYLCSQIIEKHGGRIWVKSTKGKGSTFGFDIPQKHVN